MRFSEGTLAAVVTDGYRGDFRTWADALIRQVAVVTTEELPIFAKDPKAYFDALRKWAATRPVGSDPLPDRDGVLMGWALLVRDQP